MRHILVRRHWAWRNPVRDNSILQLPKNDDSDPNPEQKYHSGIQKWTLKRKRWSQPVATAEAAAPSGPGETSLVWFHRFPIIT